MTLDSTATNGFVVNGGGLTFSGTAAAITTAVVGANPSSLRLNSQVNFASNTTLNLTANLTSATGELVFGTGGVSGTSTVTVAGVSGTNALFTASNSTFGGTITYATGSTAGVQLGAHNALGRNTVLNLTNGGTGASFRVGATAAVAGSDTSASGQFAALTGTTASTNAVFNVGATNQTGQSTALVGLNNADTTYNSAGSLGGISLNGTTANRNSFFAKVGSGTLTLGGNSSTGFGAYQVRDGAVVLSGSTGRFSSTSAQIQIYAGASVRADNSVSSSTDRLPGNSTTAGDRAVLLSGGTLHLTGTASTTAAFSEVSSGVRLTSGQSTLLIDGVGNSKATRINFSATTTGVTGAGGLEQLNSSTATVFFRSTNLGQASSTSDTLTTGGFSFAALPALTGGGGADGSTTVSILPFGFGTGATSASTVTAAESFVTYSTVNNSIRSLTEAEYASSFGNGTSNVSLNSSTTVNTHTTANALRLTAGGSLTNSSTVTVTSGALLNNGGGGIDGTGTLAFGSAATPTTAYLTTNGAMGISNGISAAHLSKNGAGNLTLTGVTTLGVNGRVAVNAGTLTLGAGSSVANATTYQISRNAELNVATTGLTLGDAQTLTGNGTVTGNVTVSTGGIIVPSSLAGLGTASLKSPGTLTVNGNLTLGTGGQYDWVVSSAQEGQYTQSRILVSGDLDLSGLTSANRFRIRPTSVLLSNTGTGNVYDFESDFVTNPTGYSWTLIAANGIIGEFSSDKFEVDTAAFTNNLNSGSFLVTRSNNSILLTFTPVPEPSGIIAVTAMGILAWRLVRLMRPVSSRSSNCGNP